MYEVIQIVGTIIISIGTIATLLKRFVVNVGTTVIEKLLIPNSKVILNNFVNALSLAGLVFIVSIGVFIIDPSLPTSSGAFMVFLGLLVVIGFMGFILFSVTYEFKLLPEYTLVRYFINACNFICYILISIIAIMFYSSILTQVKNFYKGQDIDNFSDIFSVEFPSKVGAYRISTIALIRVGRSRGYFVFLTI
ncbi:hypothetical protein [Alkalicoccobacillus gibsonii]|uniref:hypothetical protein n=1 Tax=Alkalicoccobacillus gibsonii TaxID=79881 RepID=UPI00193393CE|nr:hypothetical protein [Alkalicoccobacillus gibsonii]MBM0067988.1 hypothetical protein [Alkalicoccobacillus gibsonii]